MADEYDIELSEQEKSSLEAEATKEVAKELKDKKKKEFKDSLKAELKKKTLFKAGQSEEGEDLVEIAIDLAPHAPNIKLDGKVYYHGVKYKFTPKTASVINEICHRTWLHEAEVHGLDSNAFHGRQKANKALKGW